MTVRAVGAAESTRAVRRRRDAALATRVRAARIARHLGVGELAEKVGMSASSLSEFEHGKSVPGPARLEALAAILGLDLGNADPDEEKLFTHWRTFEELRLSEVHQAALDAFAERGFEGATIRMIADRSGMSVAGIYHHAGGKLDLLVWLLERGMRELAARARAAADEAGTPQQRLADLVACLVGFHVHRRAWASLALTEMRSLDAETRAELMDSRLGVRDLVISAFADCRGGVPSEVPDLVAGRGIVTLCAAVADWYVAAGSPDPDELAQHYAALVLAMVPTPR